MTCLNKVGFWIPRGYDYREVKVRCGNTDPYGDRTICDSCRKDRAEMGRINRHEANMAADNAALASAGWGEI